MTASVGISIAKVNGLVVARKPEPSIVKTGLVVIAADRVELAVIGAGMHGSGTVSQTSPRVKILRFGIRPNNQAELSVRSCCVVSINWNERR